MRGIGAIWPVCPPPPCRFGLVSWLAAAGTRAIAGNLHDKIEQGGR